MSKRTSETVTQSVIEKKSKSWSLGLVNSMINPDYIIKQTDRIVVIRDKYPKAKIHYLVLPREDISSIHKLNSSHIDLLNEFGLLFEQLKDQHQEFTLQAGFHAVPSLQRLHMHVISKDMISTWLKTKAHWNSFNTSFFLPYTDVIKELQNKGTITKIGPEKHKDLLATPLKCNQCSYVPKNLPKLKEHLLSHQ
ncbi:aprataxin-like protein [Pectinophora gossypiella]|uniref:aprataxin-like protein n=1 Tax=Pectinophora gossypiella TaxID=13191 RepID=UPI00214F24C7|nr:aprataxin-like protein [Pectinophora gossypiella]